MRGVTYADASRPCNGLVETRYWCPPPPSLADLRKGYPLGGGRLPTRVEWPVFRAQSRVPRPLNTLGIPQALDPGLSLGAGPSQMTPISSIARATLVKPATFAPAT